MCGILGKITLSGTHESQEIFNKALNQLNHRGPDDHGVYHTTTPDNVRISLGHTRLSILDLSRAGHQPMVSTSTGSVIVYNGEVYNFKELRATLSGKGFSFASNCDTEVILAAYDDAEENFTSALNGMFAVGIWDKARKRIILARDRLGIKPLYYYWDEKQFAFSSEVTALAALPSLHLEIDQDAMRQYLMYGYIPAPFSIYRKVRKLPAGCMLLLSPNNSGPVIARYWDVMDYYSSPIPFQSEQEVLAALRHELTQSVRRRLISDVPLGTFLSGGVDSSTVVAFMRQVNAGPVKTFTIGFSEQAWDEAPMARRIADYLGTEHHEFYFSESNTLELVRTAAHFYDEPFADPASIPTLALSRFARTQVTVALSGDGGDELFWGYNYYKSPAYIRQLYNLAPYSFRRVVSMGLQQIPLEIFKRWGHVLGHKDMLAYQLSPGIWSPRLYYPGLHRYSSDLCRPLEIGNEVLSKLEKRSWNTKTGAIDVQCSLVDQMLIKIDRASMSTALEVRVPMLDYNVVQLAARIPSRFKTEGGELKYLIRKLLGELLPPHLWDRPKKGFSVPLEPWFRTILKEWVCDELASTDHHLFDWLDRNELHAAIDDHMRGRRNGARLIWACLQLAGWDRKITSIRKQACSHAA
jgi:asparagine synthase (glutamine-hydrolysing)